TIPDWVLKQADEVVMVDLTPRALLNRLARGVVYPPERAREALANFFKESTLVALRELAMREAAYAVESRLPDEEYASGDLSGSSVQSAERLLLVITPHPSSAALIRRGRRVADYLRADCLAVHVPGRGGIASLTAGERETVERNLNFARGLRIDARILEGDDVAETIVSFARLHGVTQIFVTRGKSRALLSWFAAAFVQRIVNLARDMQV